MGDAKINKCNITDKSTFYFQRTESNDKFWFSLHDNTSLAPGFQPHIIKRNKQCEERSSLA